MIRFWRIGRTAVSIVAVAGAVAGIAVAAPAVAGLVAGGETVVAIGDSIMDGHGLSADESWPELIAHDDGWRLTDLAADGDGFVTAGDDGTTFADQVRAAIRLHPQVVLISGSSNDLNQSQPAVASAIAAEIAQIHLALPSATIVAVTPVWNENPFPAQLRQIGGAVARAAQAAGGTVLHIGQPLLGHPELMQADDVHPTAAGQLAIAAAVEQQLEGAGLH